VESNDLPFSHSYAQYQSNPDVQVSILGINSLSLENLTTVKRPILQKAIWHETKFLGRLNSPADGLEKEINESKYILTQKLDPENDGSLFYSEQTWIRAIKYIIKYSNYIFSKEQQSILVPKIYHGPDGSIDFYWQFPHFNMLLNISDQASGSFSGDDNGINKFNGFFNPDEPNFKLIPSIF
jgi:hypothetical protein